MQQTWNEHHFWLKPMYPIPWVRQPVSGLASGRIQTTEREKIPFAGCSWERGFLFLLWEVGEEVLFQCGGRSKIWSNCYYEGSWVEPRESQRSQSLVTLWSSGTNHASNNLWPLKYLWANEGIGLSQLEFFFLLPSTQRFLTFLGEGGFTKYISD